MPRRTVLLDFSSFFDVQISHGATPFPREGVEGGMEGDIDAGYLPLVTDEGIYGSVAKEIV